MGYEQLYPDYNDYLKVQMSEGFGSAGTSADSLLKAHHRYVTHLFNMLEFPSSLRDRLIIKILDVGCNDGLGLQALRAMFPVGDILGIDLDPGKVEHAKYLGFNALVCDANFLGIYDNKEFVSRWPFGLIYCTHILEHIYYPKKVATYLYNRLIDNGYMFVVLPYPTSASPGHGGSIEMGICQAPGLKYSQSYDDGKAVTEFFKSCGFTVINKMYDNFREPEIWLLLQKKGT